MGSHGSTNKIIINYSVFFFVDMRLLFYPRTGDAILIMRL